MNRSLLLRRACVVLVAAMGCSRSSDAPKVPLGQKTAGDSVRAMAAAHGIIGPQAKAALDSGNAFYRRKAYTEALASYRSASAMAPQHAAPFFGIYMVARAMGDTAMAERALADIRMRNGEPPPVSHSLNDSVLRRMHELAKPKAPTS